MRIVALVLVMAPMLSQASFDLFLMPENATNRVYRYDPINQVNLGSYQAANGTSSVAATNASPMAVSTSTTNGSLLANYSTGERSGTAGIPNEIVAMSPNGAQVMEQYSSASLESYNASNLVPQATGGLSFTVDTITYLTNSNVLAIGRNASGIVAQTFSATNLVATSSILTLVSAASTNTAARVGQCSKFSISTAASPRTAFVYRNASNALILLTFGLNSDSSLPGAASVFVTPLSEYILAGSNTQLSTVAGHSGLFVVGLDSSGTGTRVQEFQGQLGNTLFNSSYISNITVPTNRRWSMSNVVAPEPNTMIALALGGVAILKRRRKSA